MPPTTPLSLAARERLSEHQTAIAKAVSVHSAALARLHTATTRRTAIVSKQDALVAAAQAGVDAAVAEAVCVMGADIAATVLDLSPAEVRRIVKEAQ